MTDQKTLMAVCGHMDQVAGVRQMEFQDGGQRDFAVR